MTSMCGWMMLLWVVALGAIVAGAVLLIRAFSNRRGSGEPREGSAALSILRERFARGEIDAEEFEQGRRAFEP